MSAIEVRSTATYPAIQATDPDAVPTIQKWMQALTPMAEGITGEIPQPMVDAQVWMLLNHVAGGIMTVHPADFATEFEATTPHDDMAPFENLLKETAQVEESTNSEGLTPQQVIDNYIKEKVSLMLHEFEELEHSTRDSTDGLLATGLAREAFKRVFTITDVL